FALPLGEVTPLVLECLLQIEKDDGGRMWIDLDGAPVTGGGWVRVEAEQSGDDFRPRRVECRVAGIRRIGAGIVFLEGTVECRLAWSESGRGLDDQRRVDSHQAVTRCERGDGGLDVRVVLRGADVQEPSVGR